MAAPLGKFPEFNPDGGNFEVFLERFETYAAVNGIGDDKKRDIFLTTVTEGVYATLRSLLFPKTPIEASFHEASNALKNHYRPRRSVVSERYRFNQRQQEPNETIADFITAINEIAAQCEFGGFLENALRDRLIAGLRTEAIRRRLLAMPDDEASWEKVRRTATEMEAAGEDDAKHVPPQSGGARPSTNAANVQLKRPGTTVKLETPRPPEPKTPKTVPTQQRAAFPGPNFFETVSTAPLTGRAETINKNGSWIVIGDETLPHSAHDNIDGLPAGCVRCNTFYEKFVKLSARATAMLELNTRGQAQDNSLWSVARRLRVTSSNVRNVPKKDCTLGARAVNAIINPTFTGNAATRHGLNFEAVAREKFTKKTGLRVLPCGIFVSADAPWLAASPDGILTSAEAILEVKCPYVTDCWELVRGGKYDVRLEADNYVLVENGPNGYYYQVQFAMYCTGKKLCYFYVWTARNDIVVEVPFAPDFVAACVPRLQKFYFSQLLPELEERHAKRELRICKEYKDLRKL